VVRESRVVARTVKCDWRWSLGFELVYSLLRIVFFFPKGFEREGGDTMKVAHHSVYVSTSPETIPVLQSVVASFVVWIRGIFVDFPLCL
jgi:hypothetical protein